MAALLVNKYEVLRVIGHGGMGTVYDAREVESGRRVAIKWLHGCSLSANDPLFLRFKQEARIAGALDSPHVMAVFDCVWDTEKNVAFQVMELLEGQDLRTLLDRTGALDPDVALRIAAQASAGLGAAHVADVVHRDIKPENLFLAKQADGSVVVKVLDFGIAKIRLGKENTPGMTVPANPMTASGQLLGTPLYMAPEQFDGAKHVDARSDVYSMGVTLYTMLAGSAPHAHCTSVFEILRAVKTQPTPPLLERAPWVRREIVAVVEKAMSASKDARYASGAALHAALGALVEGQTGLREDMFVGVSDEQKKSIAKISTNEAFAGTVVGNRDETVRTMNKEPAPWWRLWRR